MNSPVQREEWARFYRSKLHVGEISGLHARFVSHRYPVHIHEYFVVGLVESGTQSYSYMGVRHVTPAGHVFVVNPDEPHTGEAADGAGYVYRTLNFSETVVSNLARDFSPKGRPLFLKGAVFCQPDLVHAILTLHSGLTEAVSALELETLTYQALTLLFRRHGDGPRLDLRIRNEPGAVKRVREYIENHYMENVSLSELAEYVSLSPFYLARAFKNMTGLPPHSYLDCVRLREAIVLLDRGDAIASVACAVGYADQSHFTKRFKRSYGITPGQYSHPEVKGKKQRLLILRDP